ncbi:MAG: DUF2461 domain-containing protein [Bacteroidota bacterium]
MLHFTEEFLKFFMELAANNNKEWFDLNRKRYEQFVKVPFQNFVQLTIAEISKKHPSFKDLQAKDCIFRIHRDIRFSKDKTPYKLMVSAVIAPEGRKSKAVNGVYIELGPEHFRVYGGIYEIATEDLYLVREGIVENLAEFQKIYKDAKFKKYFGGRILGEKNKIIPKEFREAAEKEPLLFNKQWYFFSEYSSDVILQEGLDKLVLDCFDAGRPMEEFFNRLIRR